MHPFLPVPRLSSRLPALLAACLAATTGIRCGEEAKPAADPQPCLDKCYIDNSPCASACADKYETDFQACLTGLKMWCQCDAAGAVCGQADCDAAEAICDTVETRRNNCGTGCHNDLENCYRVCDPAHVDDWSGEGEGEGAGK